MLLTLMLAGLAGAFVCTNPTFHDGDNIRCGDRSMRLVAIDAPELAGSPKCRRNPRAWCDDKLARAARDNLITMASSGPVSCREVAKPDRYGRPIVRCRVNGQDLGEAQLRAGLARPWP